MMLSRTGWSAPPGEFACTQDEVHVWRTTVGWSPHSLAALKQILSDDERARVDRFFFERDQRSHLVSRGWLRVLLGRYLGVSPDGLRFDYGPHGKPRLAPGAAGSPLEFNVSHSGELVVIAVTAGRSLGVDVERMRAETKVVELAERYFSERERAVLRGLDAGLQHDAFFNGWSRKEAYIKARGDGLSLPLDEFDVSLAPGEPAQLVATRPVAAEARRWSMQAFEVADGYKAALAVEGVGWVLKFWDWPAA